MCSDGFCARGFCRCRTCGGAAMKPGNIIVWTRTGLVLRILLALLLWQHFGFLVTLTAAWPVREM
jgi:hypothetical protein